MLKNVWRYSVNTGEYGGIVFAESEESATKKLREKYGEDKGIVVWLMTDDDYFDSNHSDVLECYGY